MDLNVVQKELIISEAVKIITNPERERLIKQIKEEEPADNEKYILKQLMLSVIESVVELYPSGAKAV